MIDDATGAVLRVHPTPADAVRSHGGALAANEGVYECHVGDERVYVVATSPGQAARAVCCPRRLTLLDLVVALGLVEESKRADK